MTNYEKFKEEIIKMLVNQESLALVKDKPVPCNKTECRFCRFYHTIESCPKARDTWLNAEYVERPKLTQSEWYYCKALQPDAVITLNIYGHIKVTCSKDYCCPTLGIFNDVKFSFIKQDEKWKVEDLLKLEVMDDA